jgi:serine protease AprX
MSVPALTRATTAALGLALIWPAGALAAQSGGDRDHDKVADGLEKRIAGRSDATKLHLLVSLDRRATAGQVEGLEDRVGDMGVRRRFRFVKGVAVTATKAQVERLAKQSDVTLVAEDTPVHASQDGFGGPTALNDDPQSSFGVTEARLDDPLLDGDTDNDPTTYSPDDEVAAVLDTGIDAGHPDLDGGKVLGFVECRTPLPCTDHAPYDDNGHGTHVSGTIAGDGDGDNPAGLGVAPGAGLVGVKVLDQNGDGFTSDVVTGLEWVLANKDTYGIDAVNLSLGASKACSPAGVSLDSQEVNLAYAAGLVVTVAAGNTGPDACTINSPGDAKDALTVGAMADLGVNGFKQADFSSRGPTSDGRVKPDISAPGVGIASTYPTALGDGSGYKTMNGTSMATPFVTGVALLMMDADGTFTNDDVKDAITSTAVDWGRGGDNTEAGTTGPDDDYGAGRLDAYRALAVADPVNLPPTGGPQEPNHSLREGSLPGTGATLDYTVDVAGTSFPIAATLIDVPSSCRSGGSNPDFDLRLIAPDGTTVAFAASSQRQDELGFMPTRIGVYKLRVSSFSDCGDFFMDVSGGEVSMQGTAGEPEPGPSPTQPQQPSNPPPSAAPSTKPAPVATAALVNAARQNAKRAASALKKSGLRRLLKKRSFVLRGLAPSAGRLEFVIRAVYRGHTVTVARLTRRVSSAGQPRLIVRLTKSGRRLLARPGKRRLTAVAAVVDSATGRRQRASYRVLVRR